MRLYWVDNEVPYDDCDPSAVHDATRAAESIGYVTSRVAEAASRAVEAAVHHLFAGQSIAKGAIKSAIKMLEHTVETAALAVETAAAAAANADTTATANAAIQRDFDILLRTRPKTQDQWSVLTPVPPEFFGPLWPNGPPPGWPEPGEEVSFGASLYTQVINAVGPDHPRIDVIWDPARITPEEYAALIEAIGDVVRAAGGLGVERVGSDNFGAKVGEGVLLGARRPEKSRKAKRPSSIATSWS